MLKISDLTALVRLVDLASSQRSLFAIVEPASQFKGDDVTTGYLNDLLVRNVSSFVTQESIAAVIGQINEFTSVKASLAAQNYTTVTGQSATVYGIVFNENQTLWLTRRSEQPAELLDFTVDNYTATSDVVEPSTVAPMSPVLLRQVLLADNNSLQATEVSDPTWFEKISSLNGNHKAWLLVQLNAAFTRIGRKDLFAELLESVENK